MSRMEKMSNEDILSVFVITFLVLRLYFSECKVDELKEEKSKLLREIEAMKSKSHVDTYA